MDVKAVPGCIRRALLVILVVSCGMMCRLPLFGAQSVTLTWSPSLDPYVAGYYIYHGVASRVYTNKVDVGNATNVVIDGLVDAGIDRAQADWSHAVDVGQIAGNTVVDGIQAVANERVELERAAWNGAIDLAQEGLNLAHARAEFELDAVRKASGLGGDFARIGAAVRLEAARQVVRGLQEAARLATDAWDRLAGGRQEAD